MVVFSGMTMGTSYSIKVSGLPERYGFDQLRTEIESLLDRIDRTMSTYNPESEVSRFNQYEDTSLFPVSSEVLEVLEESQRISELTGGALDITVAPLVNLWGFGADGRAAVVPDELRIEALLKQTGYQKIEVRREPPSVRKRLPGVTIDLSSVAKGHAVDRVAMLLEAKGVLGYLVEIGGEIRTGGFKTGKAPWVIGIERPVSGERAVQQVVTMGDNSMATSGDYRNYFEADGIRYSHLIDPTTGRPIRHQLASVSVIHRSCMTADGLATAVMVLGPEKAYRIALAENLAVYLMVRRQSGFEVRSTPAFQAYLKQK